MIFRRKLLNFVLLICCRADGIGRTCGINGGICRQLVKTRIIRFLGIGSVVDDSFYFQLFVGVLCL